MFIAIDIGNTHTVVGIYNKDNLYGTRRLTSSLKLSKDDIFKRVNSLLVDVGGNKKDIDGIGISSVVPKLTNIYAAMAKKHFRHKPMIISTRLNLGIKVFYDKPEALGADRICNAIAGFAKYNGPLIIIDFGTATTYDVIASNGDFLGGVIAPGIETSAVSLHKQTAKLPQLNGKNLKMPDTVIGRNTIDSMRSGIVLGAIDAMTEMVNRIQKEILAGKSKKAVVIATGGFSKFVAEQAPVIQHVEPTLVLDGIRLIFDRVKSKKG
jgi:type III pantothenate kinase